MFLDSLCEVQAWSPFKTTGGVTLVTPAVPAGLSVAVVSLTEQTPSWGFVPGATGFDLQRSFTSGSGFVDFATDVQGYSYPDTTIPSGQKPYYKVRSKNGLSSAYSAQFTSDVITTEESLPTIISKLSFYRVRSVVDGEETLTLVHTNIQGQLEVNTQYPRPMEVAQRSDLNIAYCFIPSKILNNLERGMKVTDSKYIYRLEYFENFGTHQEIYLTRLKGQ